MLATTKNKVLVALSGGVDSSVCTRLLQEKGYYIEGAVLRMSPAHDATVAAAQESAESLGIKLHIIDAQEIFDHQVIDYFCEEYLNGRTPNPCIRCNPLVKFDLMTKKADELGFDYVATGHYAKILTLENGRYAVAQADCRPRDQSYMLYRLTQHQLEKLLFPLAELEKTHVREIASDAGLSSANAPDSQENCFIPDNDYAAYIEHRCGKGKGGNFISPEGKIVAPHKGLLHYTIGQRKHLGIALGKPVFIKNICPDSGDIYLAYSGDEYEQEILLTDMVYQPFGELTSPIRCGARIRSVAKNAPATLYPLENGCARVVFDAPERAPAPGQSCVCYDDNGMVLGGGFIAQAK